jgi:hypothetical protein
MRLRLHRWVTAEPTAVVGTIGAGFAVTRGPSRRIVEVDPTADERWDRFVGSCPGASVYHHSLWLRVLAAEYGQPPIGLACEDTQGQLLGVLPLILTRGLPFRRNGSIGGRRLSSLPRTPTAGPLATDRSATRALLLAAMDRARSRPGVLLQLKAEADLDLVPGLVGRPWRPTYGLELPRHADEIRFGNARNHARIKWAVHKAERLDVRVRPADSERDLRDWYALYLETMRSYAVPPRPYRLFVAIWDLLRPPGLMELLLAERHDGGRSKLLAGSIYLKFRETVFYAFNGRRREDLAMRPNDLLMWTAIHDATRAGHRRFDLGEVDESNVTLAEFKKKWGATERWLQRYYFPDPRTTVESVPDGYALRLGRALWRRLPLSATAILGDRTYGYL